MSKITIRFLHSLWNVIPATHEIELVINATHAQTHEDLRFLIESELQKFYPNASFEEDVDYAILDEVAFWEDR